MNDIRHRRGARKQEVPRIGSYLVVSPDSRERFDGRRRPQNMLQKSDIAVRLFFLQIIKESLLILYYLNQPVIIFI